MTPEKNDKKLTRWLLMATIALLSLVLCLQLWQMFGRTDPGSISNTPPLTQDASSPEQPQTAGTSPETQAPAAAESTPVQAPAAAEPAPVQMPPAAAQAPSSGTPAQQVPASGGEEAAKQAAFTHAGISAADASSVRCRLDWDDGCQVYEIEFWADGIEYDYEIDASSCAVLKAGQEWGDHHHGGGSAPQQQAGAFIGEEAAKSAALTHAGVSAADVGYIRCELDEDDGLRVYEIEFQVGGAEYDYEISASDGTVLKAELDH